jgi:hypothetical protein
VAIVEAVVVAKELATAIGLSSVLRSIGSLFGNESRVDKLRKLEKKYGIDSPQYRAAAEKWPKAAAKRARRAQARQIRAGQIAPSRRLTPVEEWVKRERRIVDIFDERYGQPVRTAAGRILPRVIAGGGAVAGILWPSEITPEVPIPQSPTPSPGPTTRPVVGRTPRTPGPVVSQPLPGSPAPAQVVPEVEPMYDWYEIEADTRRAVETVPELVLPTPAPVPSPSRITQVTDWLLSNRGLISAAVPLLLPRSGSTRRRTGLADPLTPISPPGIDPLTWFNTGSLPYPQTESASLDDQCRERARRKRGKKKPRTVCYSGTYTERASGLTKRKRRKVPCK